MTLESLSPSSQNTLEDPSPAPPLKRQKTTPSDSAVRDIPGSKLPDAEDRDDPAIDTSFPEPAKEEAQPAQRGINPETGCYTSSLYVDAFDLALDTVLKDESYLFDPNEQEVFAKYRSLHYEAQHLYVRLFLRKTDAWFRINKLQYVKDIADVEAACAALQDPGVGFADKDDKITMEEAAGLLGLDELKTMAKEAKCSGSNKAELIEQLRKTSKTQGSLQGKGGQLKLNFDGRGNYMNRETQAIRKILSKTGPCIRLTSYTATLFNRVHLVFYRSTQWSEKSLTTVILARTLRRNFPPYTVSRTTSIFPDRSSLLSYESALQLQDQIDTHLLTPSATSLAAVLETFEATYPIWRNTLLTTSSPSPEHLYLLRFTPLWIQTRIVHKGAFVLGRLHHYAREAEVLTELLQQSPYHPSRRGSWYTRLALLQEKHLPTPATLRTYRQLALQTCCTALEDPQTHLIYHRALQSRLLRLERALKTPKREQHDFSHTPLTAPLTTTITATRLSAPEIGAKTVWQHPLTREPCDVETAALAHYESQGHSGLHDEGRTLKTVFAVLFYDLLFLPLPNVFQTAYQTAPLDLFTDAFYPARSTEINHLLARISSGSAPAMIENFWQREEERRVCVVGLDWEVGLEACVGVARGMGGGALAGVCRVLAEEYRVRQGGMPDLTLWKMGEGDKGAECRFVEVKSENDRLSETQRVWGSVLRGSGVVVEVCWVREEGKEVGEGKKKGKAKGNTKAKGR